MYYTWKKIQSKFVNYKDHLKTGIKDLIWDCNVMNGRGRKKITEKTTNNETAILQKSKFIAEFPLIFSLQCLFSDDERDNLLIW